MSTENAKGVLLLSHVGFSFLEDLANKAAARGLRCHVLSSLPEPQHQESRPAVLADLADHLRVTEGHVLTPRDVEDYLDHLRAEGEDVRCCLTVWEGYRHLMALANDRLGVPDLDEKQVLQLRDKVVLRNRLADAGLSRSRASVLNPETLAERQREGGRHFVKPVSGIASFGTFPLSADTTWADLERIAAEALSDTVYAGIFTSKHDPGGPAAPSTAAHGSVPGTEPARGTPGMEFLVEDYVPGREFSFEVIALDGEPNVVAVHEKCELTETAGAVLEDACVSPPTSLAREDLAAGLHWVSSVLDALDLDWGCFHVEARHAPSGWDLIEVNPRVGGSLISPSVGALTGGPDLLDLWLDSLLAAHRPARFREKLESLSYIPDGIPRGSSATFFRVFFAAPGTIREIRLNDGLLLRPVLSHVLLEPGDVVEQASREVFLGQVLWSMDRADRDAILPELVPASERAIEIVYEKEHA
ncbi:ATP-grasp domain-containing protein (plasmid) [Streptomyces cyaneofuscatus]|uniref:ATP-grasp domain-containing protein n=1 Tax=Streptomyces cyaneofuscatus TaxID=66883 RepID=UPI002F90CEAD|nr:ATP-grasp domain-containing protein [Streptomyces cyaneofuscatus]